MASVENVGYAKYDTTKKAFLLVLPKRGSGGSHKEIAERVETVSSSVNRRKPTSKQCWRML